MREALNGVNLTQIDSLNDLTNELKKEKSNSRGLKRHALAFGLKIEVLKRIQKNLTSP
ncbi:hypothetical protein HPHPP11B_1117 [Helicobacter pylori Hp P-11b]|uniref:Uncharacterized protein n=1 Tax=Helicobacter pylori Hp P-11b TaxID=992106 RepID=I9YLF3_HELPX|nr:hypothetical protein HPHPP11_1244 [Helicobacter pylori Hp P-11]EJC29580.1 hypothetical protein HPHPP11B_1117 [Helicobacter pylori Hp P-11b]